MGIQLTNTIKWMGAFAALAVLSSSASAFAYPVDPVIMKNKGYSPILIRATEIQTAHQEWRVPPKPKYTPVQQFFRNILWNDPMGSVDEFTLGKIRRYDY